MDLRLDDDVLDRIDEIVPPGSDIDSPLATSLDLPWLTDATLRRRARPGSPQPPQGDDAPGSPGVACVVTASSSPP
jgi:hypothetical protein